MGSAIVFLVIFLIIAVVLYYGYDKVSVAIDDVVETYNQKLRDEIAQIPKPTIGEMACDLSVTFNWRVIGASDGLIVQRVIFLNSEGQTTNIVWSNCHTVKSASSLSFIMDFFDSNDFTSLEWIFPARSHVTDVTYKLSFVLIDSNGLERKSLYQNLSYVMPAFDSEFDFSQRLVYRDLPFGDYKIEIIGDNNARFADHKDGQSYIQQVPRPKLT